ncbi:uncharacterized protein LOC135847225 isoform X2 [Planococcus citri]|uniref:uncharacterized protein LOC135847225 isoform X2 n=1 Tax=Planococcus citri TaxID=170843 RepID=UPI0031F871E1
MSAYFILLWFILCNFHSHKHITKSQQISINSTRYNKQIEWKDCMVAINGGNEAYELDNQDIKVQFHSPLNVSEEKACSDECCKQSHGVLKKAQIIPLWCFCLDYTLDSSTDTNVILVWKNIADRQLKRVDLFISAVLDCLDSYDRTDKSVTFGVHDAHERFRYTLDAEFQHIPIPKIMYRVVQGSYYVGGCGAVIIIHNEPAHVPDSDKLCDNHQMLSGWEMIVNNDPKSGLTYVCQLTGDLCDKLGIVENWAPPLHLDAIPFSEHPEWDFTFPIEDVDGTDRVHSNFFGLCENMGI